MRRLLVLWSCSLLLAGFLAGCDTYVEDIDPPIDTIPDERLNDPAQIPFLVQGVHARFADTYGGLALLSGGLSDEFFFDQNVPNATFPTYMQIDQGDILLDNNSVDGVLNDLASCAFWPTTWSNASTTTCRMRRPIWPQRDGSSGTSTAAWPATSGPPTSG
ncbi:hypothetical protein [Rhodothermus marinus]|uniref:hypothetical protein n=1 Tax=Rhodothermus marinus TaxID=29549 RepID=UPI001FB25485|nr:hypothetical protein [Rhodothermus marinus]